MQLQARRWARGRRRRRPRHIVRDGTARGGVHDSLEPGRKDDAAAPDRVDRLSVGGGGRPPGVEFLIDGKVVFRNRLEPYAFGADGRDETQQEVADGLPRHVVALAGASPLHRPCAAREQRRRQSDRHENRRRPRSAVAGTSCRARGNVAPERSAPGSGRPRSALLERSRWELSARPRSCRPVDDDRGPTVRRACSADRLLDQERLRRRPADDQVRGAGVDDASHSPRSVIGTQREPR